MVDKRDREQKWISGKLDWENNKLQILAIAFFAVLVFLRLFYRLGDIGIQDEDEAYHAMNAYEMFRANNWIVNTFRGQLDYYNSKPPLGLDAIIFCFHLLGPGLLSLKLPAACFGFGIFLVLIVFLARNRSFQCAALFSGTFLLLNECYDYHCFRAGDFDALFNLFYTLSILSLIKARKNIRWLYLYSLTFSLAFLTKSFHAAGIFLIGLCVIPDLKKDLNRKNLSGAALTAIVPVALWAVKRSMCDGTAFLYAVLHNEPEAKLKKVWIWDYFIYLAKMPVFQFLFVMIGFTLILHLVHRQEHGTVIPSENNRYLKKVLWLWVCVPVIFFSLSGSFLTWYIFASFIGAAALSAVYGEELLVQMTDRRLKLLCQTVILLGCACIGIKALSGYQYAGTGGSQGLIYWQDLRELKEAHTDLPIDTRVYIQNVSRGNPEEEVSSWHYDLISYSALVCDFTAVDGGVTEWMKDPEAILVLNKNLWEKYSDLLTGYVILQDNGFLFFSHERY